MVTPGGVDANAACLNTTPSGRRSSVTTLIIVAPTSRPVILTLRANLGNRFLRGLIPLSDSSATSSNKEFMSSCDSTDELARHVPDHVLSEQARPIGKTPSQF